jgi:hypothetical protein
MQDAADHSPIIDTPGARLGLRQMRFDRRPSFIAVWRQTRDPLLGSGSLLCNLGSLFALQIFPALATREFCSQAIEFPLECRGALVILSPKSANFPVFSPGTGNKRAETGSLMTASSAKIMCKSL